MTTFLITGGNTGIGLATAVALARDGGRVYIACRSAAAGEAALARIKSESGSGDSVSRFQPDSLKSSARAFRASGGLK